MRPGPDSPSLEGNLYVDPTLPLSLSLTLEGWSNQLKMLRTAYGYNQVGLTAKTDSKIGRSSLLTRIQISCNDHLLYIKESGKTIDIRETTQWMERYNLFATPLVLKSMTTLAWNARGVSRPSFKGNLNHLIHCHKPEVIVVTELCTGRKNVEKILRSISYECFV